MAAWRSTIEQKAPRLRRRLVNLAKKPSTALSQEAEVDNVTQLGDELAVARQLELTHAMRL